MVGAQSAAAACLSGRAHSAGHSAVCEGLLVTLSAVCEGLLVTLLYVRASRVRALWKGGAHYSPVGLRKSEGLFLLPPPANAKEIGAFFLQKMHFWRALMPGPSEGLRVSEGPSHN